MVADGQVVLQAEGLQHHSVPDREGEAQLLGGVRWEGGEKMRGVILLHPGRSSETVGSTHREEAAALSCLVSCQAQTGASRPDSATGMVECHSLGS